jgi:hypothetical protein
VVHVVCAVNTFEKTKPNPGGGGGNSFVLMHFDEGDAPWRRASCNGSAVLYAGVLWLLFEWFRAAEKHFLAHPAFFILQV